MHLSYQVDCSLLHPHADIQDFASYQKDSQTSRFWKSLVNNYLPNYQNEFGAKVYYSQILILQTLQFADGIN